MTLASIDLESVHKAAEEFDRLGREAFLAQYGYGKSRNYFVEIDGRQYDSKALAGVAHQYAVPSEGALRSDQFSGGERTIVQLFKRLGLQLREVPTATQSHWLFQGNPEQWDLVEELKSWTVGTENTWTASRYRDEMQAGDTIVLWQSGPAAGAYAMGELTGTPQLVKRPEFRPGDDPQEWRVPFRLTRKLEPPVHREELRDHPVLSKSLIIRSPQATNFRLTTDEWNALLSLINGPDWEQFILWAEKFHAWPLFDADERDYKIVIAEHLVRARKALVANDPEWIPLLKKAFGPPNNLTPWQLHDRFLAELEADPDLAVLLRALWSNDGTDADRIRAFVEALPATLKVGPGGRLTLAAFLLIGVDVYSRPMYRPTVFANAFRLVGYPGPAGDEGETYEHALEFLDAFRDQLALRGTQLRDRLDAQSLVWAVLKSKPKDWSASDLEALEAFRNGANAVSALADLVQQFIDETGYPRDSDRKRQDERALLAADLSEANLDDADVSTFNRIAGPAAGSPGNQANFNRALNEEGGVGRVVRATHHLLYGEGDVVQRFDDVFSGEYAVAGMKEGILTKLLALANQSEWVPAFITAGKFGKRQMLAAIGVEPPPDGLSPGALAVDSNRRLRDALAPHFGDDTTGMLEFAWWMLIRVHDDGESIEDLAHRLHLDPAYLLRIERLIRDKRQIVLHGPPGTGKTYVARELARFFARNGGSTETVQFHPSYAYEDFVEGYRPRIIDGVAGFGLAEGPLKRIAAAATEAPGVTNVLLIDELNRGNVAKVFGELYFLLEYRDEVMALQYSSEPFALPGNLWIIGTMNTADRSIALVDAALRRRFYFIPFFPDEPPVKDLLRRWLADEAPDYLWVADVVDRANDRLGVRHQAIGPSYFMRSDLSEEWISDIWEHSIIPYIAEQFFGEEDRLAEFALDVLRSQTNDAPSAIPGLVEDALPQAD